MSVPAPTRPSPAAAWLHAARPRTLPAAVAPVLVGVALGQGEEGLRPVPAALCLGFALLIQVGTNFANDYLDHLQGADGEARIGPSRAVASGWIGARAMRAGMVATLGLAFLLGLGLLAYGGWWLIGIGLASVFCAYAYTAKPFCLGYRGLGDLFVVLFFGLVAVSVTAYLQAGRWVPGSFPVGFAVGLLVNNLLVVNNYRDRGTDALAGKRTLAVRFGPGFCRSLYGTSLLACAGVATGLAAGGIAPWAPVSILGLVPGVAVWRLLPRAEKRDDFQGLLARTAASVVAFGSLLALALFASG